MTDESAVPEGTFSITWIGDRSHINPDDDNVDIAVNFDGGPGYIATFFTLQNLATLLSRYKQTGECASGLYLWASDMIVVERLTDEVIWSTVADLLQSGEFVSAFTKDP